ncbi:sigma-54 dependent transcriptional regulator [Metapseudomonas boanensis]|uniref:Sigma-54-dependent Fis family transcriptional regulator n=1 Tax=Metapseudomonas boanensis TaxID=2822138 RepID=A0ABS5XMK0_9GAMM|nr:sigma-54 dependent transcriptional regulator [Pseudomonas boanensis]MBT8768910.1 sigma-54-dependent Fis family transcriptional regulator [Pseudomonas boanensis]
MFDSVGTAVRRLLVVDPCKDCEALLPLLSNNGWDVESCALQHAIEQVCDVGLLRLQIQHLKRPESVKQLIRNSGTEWIAVVSPDTLRSKEIGDFIGEWFFDFHTLPFDTPRLQCVLGRAFGMARLRGRMARASTGARHDQLVGHSPSIIQLRKLVTKLAQTDSAILVRGESGTGKELVAKALHQQSRRSEGPFVAINCGAISESLIQSELFGHEKGAFTGAHQRKIGRLESANGGTLFLDEIGDLPLEMQANLLRFLQEKTIERVGGNAPIEVDVRVIAATHVDLESAVAEGRFREDLYYRLNVLQIQATPLRERKQDIPLLADHFADFYANEVGRRPRDFSAAAIASMVAHGWPGNVRELANRVRRAQVLAEGRQVGPIDLGLEVEVARFETCGGTLNDYLCRAERQALEDVMSVHTTNMSRAARALGISRPTFYRLLHKHGII